MACPSWNKPGKLTVIVVNKNGEPIEGASVGIGFEVNKVSGFGMQRLQKSGESNDKGIFSAEAIASNYVGYSAKKKGEYYRSFGKPIQFNENSVGTWKPWNPKVELVLRKIENPIPMYAKVVNLQIPAYGKSISFDLVAGDWVIPYGKGTNKDFSFVIRKEVKDPKNHWYTLLLEFSNEGDGIQPVEWSEEDYGSTYKLPRYAPEHGYQPKLSEEISIGEFGNNKVKSPNFFYRVRTVLNKDGSVKQAFYGKIPNGINVQYMNSEDANLAFTYYLNPDKTRNMEFDPTKNHFPTKRFDIRVLSP